MILISKRKLLTRLTSICICICSLIHREIVISWWRFHGFYPRPSQFSQPQHHQLAICFHGHRPNCITNLRAGAPTSAVNVDYPLKMSWNSCFMMRLIFPASIRSTRGWFFLLLIRMSYIRLWLRLLIWMEQFVNSTIWSIQ